jgi:hypothetical protein
LPLGELLPCLDYLLSVLERMHRVHHVVSIENHLWTRKLPPEHLEARTRLLAAGFDPNEIEAQYHEQLRREMETEAWLASRQTMTQDPRKT